MVTIFSCSVKIQPKPRGILSKNGHLYHNSKKYVEFKQAIGNSIKIGKLKPQSTFKYIVFQIYFKPRKGHPFDGDNCQGAVQDALKQHGIITDDNYQIIPCWCGSLIKSDKDLIKVYFIDTKKEFIKIIDKYLD